ncbi:DNA-binding transcriptional LysR family regulator [Pusillimonas noertemannii]|uniref:DNA-binding transcriptional LysR family regulator n=1 Tax=Pusillimonas noertemannii TaxID=305977 RepID=A0A2U1CKX9_9BURK|nr:LysR family transcriptional regulator [Pusillimonas noertemannii]PVY61670.1 DNA-binding transcriptional LysR family regulator [Pusillimonas noertemannii]
MDEQQNPGSKFRFSALDLNLLRIFNAVMAEQSVVGAGRRLKLSPSAVSHGLRRLRSALGDELFVRDGNSIRATAFALEFAPTVHEMMLRLQLALETRGFDPKTSKRRFLISGTDFASATLMPVLLQSLIQQSASVRVEILSASTLDIAHELDAGRIDLALGTFVEIGSRFNSSLLTEIEQVYLTRADHAVQELTLEDLAKYPHVVVRLADTPHTGISPSHIAERGLRRNVHIGDSTTLEGVLSRHGLTRHIAAVVPHPLAIAPIVATSHAIGMLPRHLADATAHLYGLRLHTDPCGRSHLPYSMVWHEQAEADAGIAWLRREINRAARGCMNLAATLPPGCAPLPSNPSATQSLAVRPCPDINPLPR